ERLLKRRLARLDRSSRLEDHRALRIVAAPDDGSEVEDVARPIRERRLLPERRGVDRGLEEASGFEVSQVVAGEHDLGSRLQEVVRPRGMIDEGAEAIRQR